MREEGKKTNEGMEEHQPEGGERGEKVRGEKGRKEEDKNKEKKE